MLLDYIDDTLLIGDEPKEIENAVEEATQLFDRLGLTVCEKIVLVPVQRIKYLSF